MADLYADIRERHALGDRREISEATERCLGCHQPIAEHEMQRMAGLPYHSFCAEAEMDFMDRAAAHFDTIEEDGK